MLLTPLRRLLAAGALAPALWLAGSAIAAPVVAAGEPPREIGARSHRETEVVSEGEQIGDDDTFWIRTAALLLVLVATAGIVWFGWRQGQAHGPTGST
jgi:hypothetical protein